jgi:hypothetical protein
MADLFIKMWYFPRRSVQAGTACGHPSHRSHCEDKLFAMTVLKTACRQRRRYILNDPRNPLTA